ncbi:unnamed protein product [Allacma fusca]|uniref:Peptidase S1 domain-containing protein n=1 Tax=Allacma fusca TaxID=39272 RepID=A0A8J2PDC7_9HEXA|nr:unnamed protein product [Allacma fusca]
MNIKACKWICFVPILCTLTVLLRIDFTTAQGLREDFWSLARLRNPQCAVIGDYCNLNIVCCSGWCISQACSETCLENGEYCDYSSDCCSDICHGIYCVECKPIGAGLATGKIFQSNLNSAENFYDARVEDYSGDEERIQTGKIVVNPPSYMVGIKYANGNAFCTGTLITPWRILTAAHCTTPSKRGQLLQVVLGLSDIRTENVLRNLNNPNVSIINFVYEDVVNGDWIGDKNGNINDIAIIKLKEPVKDIFKPITLASNDEKFRSHLKAMGWGFHNCTHGSPEALREATGTYVDIQSCAYWLRRNMPRSMVCMIYESEGRPASVASGDSGGPVFSLRLPSQPVQIGILSYGKLDPKELYIPDYRICADKLSPQVYTRVSSHIGFILKHAPGVKFIS